MNNSNNKKKIITVTVTVFLLVAMMIFSGVSTGTVGVVQNVVGMMLQPIDRVFYAAGTKLNDAFVYVFGTAQMRAENETLKIENEKLKQDILLYESAASKMDFLEEEYQLLKSTKLSLQKAYITARDPGNLFLNFNINVGSSNGVKAGDIVLQGVRFSDTNYVEGVVGKIEEVGTTWSKVSTIVDEDSSIAFKSARTNDYGVLNGRGDKGIYGYMFGGDADIKIGDKLMTSGLGGVYPRDLYIGDVVDVKLTEELLIQVIVESKVDFARLYRVLVMDRNEGIYEQD